LCFVFSKELTNVKKPVLIIAQPHVYFYNAFQLSEDEGKSVLLLRLQNDCLRSLRTAFIFVRDLGPLEKPREL